MLIEELQESTPVNWYRQYLTEKKKQIETSPSFRKEFLKTLGRRMKNADPFDYPLLEDIFSDVEEIEMKNAKRRTRIGQVECHLYKSPFVTIQVSEKFKGNVLDEVTKELVSSSIVHCGGRIRATARYLGVAANTIRRMINRYGIKEEIIYGDEL